MLHEANQKQHPQADTYQSNPTDHSHEVPHRKRPVSCSVLDKKRHSSTTLTDEHDERSTKVLTETPVSGHFLLPDTTKSAFLVPENAALALHDHHDDTIDLYPSSFDFPNSLKLSKVISEKEEPRCLSAFRDPDKQHVQLHQETSSELVSTHIAKTAAEMQLALVTRQLQLALKENEELKSRVQNMEEGSHMPPLTSMSESSSFSSISSGHQHQEEILKIHMRAQLGLIEFLEGEDDVSAAMARFKKQLEIDDTV
ncbi:hypothetical protein DFQ28_002776 [Apophysomyces sp. BC1034]|nr:hypothetical protein DFQ30_003073 [Apophysomyces sp. BC1015]KAG0189891.1 hypothetical protein DFQ28_002776 [Apophysomyces sp. BC1034]